MPKEEDDPISFEGEATLGAEYADKLDASESESLYVDPNIYPDATVNIVPESASVFQLRRKHEKEPPALKLDPDFQRKTVWSDKQKSELIESIIMGIPLPLIYVKEDEKGVYIIVDGRQRLTTLFQFMNHEFALQNLTVLKSLNDSYFSETSKNGTRYPKYLTQAQQNKVEDCSLTLHVIKPPTKDRVTFDLFDRVNRGGTRLNNQEMRNAIYQGPATLLLNKLVELDSFKVATENTIKPDRMKDKYLILRLIGFYIWRKGELLSVKEIGQPLVEYRSDLEDFLGKTMLFLNDSAGEKFCGNFPAVFDKAMISCVAVLGVGCFRLPKKGGGPRRPISMALFEAVSYFMIEALQIEGAKAEQVKEGMRKLLLDNEFIQSAEYIVGSNKSVNKRFQLIEESIEDIKND